MSLLEWPARRPTGCALHRHLRGRDEEGPHLRDERLTAEPDAHIDCPGQLGDEYRVGRDDGAAGQCRAELGLRTRRAGRLALLHRLVVRLQQRLDAGLGNAKLPRPPGGLLRVGEVDAELLGLSARLFDCHALLLQLLTNRLGDLLGPRLNDESTAQEKSSHEQHYHMLRHESSNAH